LGQLPVAQSPAQLVILAGGVDTLVMKRITLLAVAVVLCAPVVVIAASVTIATDKPGHPISPTLNGIFFEDINFAADGGLYPERVKNGSFEFSPDPTMGWRKVDVSAGTEHLDVRDDQPLNANNPHYLRLTVDSVGEGGKGSFGILNEGFRGMGIAKGEKYIFSTYARNAAQPMTLLIEVQDHAGKPIASAELANITGDWKKYSMEIECPIGDLKGQLRIAAKTAGTVDLDMVSLLPAAKENEHPNALRRDLVQLLKDLRPKFMRFPGGCIVEGRTLASRYQWKNTIGDVSQRKLIVNRWNTEFRHRLTPDYFQSYGLGFFEFFQLCEDIGAKPLPILNCGMACQFNTAELAPLDDLQPYIQDALDLIEFANGPADSKWGSQRAAMGHPAPFNMDRIGIGNEQWGKAYFDRYILFATAIKAKYPQMLLISGAGPFPEGFSFAYAWKRLTELKGDIVDEHYYRDPEWFLNNTHRYDNYDRSKPKVFAGEFAAQSVGIASPDNKNNWQCALSEAAFMTGLERNSDVVVMSSYAPLFGHVDAWQWTPNLIWFDNLRSYGTPNYYVQKLFSTNTGTTLLPVEVTDGGDRLYTVASRDDASGDVILKAVNAQSSACTLHLTLSGMAKASAMVDAQVLASSDLHAENSLDEPTKVAPVAAPQITVGGPFDRELPAYSVTVFRIHPDR
jgi:alpha-N-arabinofuranosidase